MTPRPIIIIFFKTSDEKKILKATRELKTYKRNKDKDDSRFLVRNIGNEETVKHIFKIWKEKNLSV